MTGDLPAEGVGRLAVITHVHRIASARELGAKSPGYRAHPTVLARGGEARTIAVSTTAAAIATAVEFRHAGASIWARCSHDGVEKELRVQGG